jgi:glucose-1-phosphate thymidylyltransferase
VEVSKGLILAGGAGTRLRPITNTSAKQLVPVANKPVLFYGIEALVAAGVTRIGMIVSPDTGDEIRAAAGDGSRFGAAITYLPQPEPLGLAHALLTAEPFLGEDPFVMYLGDNLLREGIASLVDGFRSRGPDALILLTPVPDPSSYGVAELDGDRVVRLVEKPTAPTSDLALVGVYLFGNGVFEAARSIDYSARGELEITDTIQRLIDDGRRVESRLVRGWWKDTGRPEDLLEANRLVLEDVDRRVEGRLVDSRVDGRVVVEAGATLERALIRGPAVIGAGSRVEDAYIGPYTSIGADVSVWRAEIEHSILLSGSSVADVGTRVEASILGRGASVARRRELPASLRVTLGDGSAVELTA